MQEKNELDVEVAHCYVPREWWDEVKRLLTNRMNFEREEVQRRPEMGEARQNALLNQAIAFDYAVRLMMSFEEDRR